MSFDPRLVDMIMRLRQRGVSDAATLRAVEQVPRKAFVRAEDAERAYSEAALPIDCGQVITAPLATAMLVQLLQAGPEHKTLMIGGGSGWLAGVLSRQCKRVYVVERYVGLAKGAEARLRAQGLMNIEIRHGDGRYGWPGQAPFDRIVFGCGLRAVPEGVMAQLAKGGRLVAVVDGMLTTFDRARTKVTEREVVAMELPMIEAGKSRTL